MTEDFLKQKFTLVLSGGGALGIAHLGVLHDLEARKCLPSEIVGTSMGAIIGACVAIGLNEAQIYKEIKAFSSLQKWLKFSFSGNAIVDNKKIAKIFKNIFSDKKMKDTLIPLKLIATNLKNGDKRVFTAKDDLLIADVVLASMAIPGVFSEKHLEGEVYGDGFLCENLGIMEASFMHILAVDVLGENSFEKSLPDNFFKTSNVLEMFEKSMRLLIYNQSKRPLAQSKKDITLLTPTTKDYSTFHFHKYEEIRALGLGLLQ